MKKFLFSILFFLLIVSALIAQQSGTLQLNDGSIYYETMGEGVPVVFLHGGKLIIPHSAIAKVCEKLFCSALR